MIHKSKAKAQAGEGRARRAEPDPDPDPEPQEGGKARGTLGTSSPHTTLIGLTAETQEF